MAIPSSPHACLCLLQMPCCSPVPGQGERALLSGCSLLDHSDWGGHKAPGALPCLSPFPVQLCFLDDLHGDTPLWHGMVWYRMATPLCGMASSLLLFHIPCPVLSLCAPRMRSPSLWPKLCIYRPPSLRRPSPIPHIHVPCMAHVACLHALMPSMPPPVCCTVALCGGHACSVYWDTRGMHAGCTGAHGACMQCVLGHTGHGAHPCAACDGPSPLCPPQAARYREIYARMHPGAVPGRLGVTLTLGLTQLTPPNCVPLVPCPVPPGPL